MTDWFRPATAALLLAAFPALAEGPGGKGYPLSVAVGQSAWLCERSEVVCPLAAPMCDDPAVATVEDGGSRGLRIVGHRPGRTACSVQLPDRTRRVFAVTVKEPGPAAP